MAAFPEIEKIRFEGPQSKNMLAFHHYDENEVVEGKPMKDHFRFAVAYWHTFRGAGADPFGPGTMLRPWEAAVDTVENAQNRVRVAFEFMEKLGAHFYCFHDRDVAPEGGSLSETNKNLDAVVKVLKEEQQRSGIQLLWGTANLFSNPRYVHGAATSPNADAFAFAAAQVKKAIEVTKELGGAGYTFWGGREGYQNLWNTDLKREFDHLAAFMHMAVDHAKKIGFTGQFYFEPKPKEPTKHQYDYDSASVHGFLERYDLVGELFVNIEANHATLAGHSFHHEVAYAVDNGIFGSVDANRGDPQSGWDTDQFPNSVEEMSLAMYEIMRSGGFTTGGFNFDTKLRRQSMARDDLFHGHVGGIDTLARSLLVAARLIEDGVLESARDARYAAWADELGTGIMGGQVTLLDLEERVAAGVIDPVPVSGRQEQLENLVSRALWRTV
ncbi:MAG: xylose isomerase [Acidobacteria bacterium]|nr:xylose isomerase [Acidobacteriota bacterium]